MTPRQRAASRLFSALAKGPTTSTLAATALAGPTLAPARGGSARSSFNGPSSADDGGSSGGGSGGFASGDDGGGAVFGSGRRGGSGGARFGGGTGCDASCSAAGGKCTGTVCNLTENPGMVATATQTQLQGKGTADSAFVWLYPYDKTVFPKGLLSPTVQFGGGASDAEFVRITSKTLDYMGYFAGGAASQVTLSLPQKSWVAVNAAVGAGDVASVQVTKISGGKVSGPISESWPI